MAWKWRIVGKREHEDAVEISVEYFNDTNPTKVFATRNSKFEAAAPVGEVEARLSAEGLSIRRNRQLVNTLSNDLPVGKEGLV